jgi:hypothetical protein
MMAKRECAKEWKGERAALQGREKDRKEKPSMRRRPAHSKAERAEKKCKKTHRLRRPDR